MDSSAALEQILRYIRLPDCKWTGSFRHSEEVAISRWAANEIMSRIVSNMNAPATEFAWDFYALMVRFAQSDCTSKQRRIFKIAADAAEEIAAMLG